MKLNILLAVAVMCLGLIPAQSGEVIIKDVVITVESPAASDQIDIVGPENISSVPTEAVFYLTGTPTIDLAKPLLEQIDWLTGEKRIKLFFLAPGVPKESVSLRAELVFGVEGTTLQPYAKILFENNGQYRLALIQDNNLIEHLINVGNSPGPSPTPEPLPLPLPGTKYQIMFFHDTDKDDNLPKEQVALLSGLKTREELKKLGHTFMGSYDLAEKSVQTCKNGVCTIIKTPPRLSKDVNTWADWIRNTNTPLPAMVMWDGKSDKMIPKMLPKDLKELEEMLK